MKPLFMLRAYMQKEFLVCSVIEVLRKIHMRCPDLGKYLIEAEKLR